MLYIPVIMLGLISCQSTHHPASTEKEQKEDFYWEKERTDLLSITDMVLIYAGGAHRNVSWDKEHFVPYVGFAEVGGQEQWLFDGFLFLEFTNGVAGDPRIFATGYYGQPAGKSEWAKLVEYYFTPGQAVYALDQAVAETEKRADAPPCKRKIVISIPEPIVAGKGSNYEQLPADYWGSIDGKKLNFTDSNDRIAAVKWYIDYVCSKFNAGNFQHVELAGFYWLAEESLHTKDILVGIGSYLNSRMYSFNWIPYWKSKPDYLDWKSLAFNYAYLQPNYFFNTSIPYSRLTEACQTAKRYDLDLEMEWDMNASAAAEPCKASRLYDYMKAFRENSMLESKRMAYYVDTDAVYRFCHSKYQEDVQLYIDFCKFIIEHQSKYKEKTHFGQGLLSEFYL